MRRWFIVGLSLAIFALAAGIWQFKKCRAYAFGLDFRFDPINGCVVDAPAPPPFILNNKAIT